MNAIFTALAGAVLVLGAAEAQTAAQGHGNPQSGPPPFQLPSAPAPSIAGPYHQNFPGQLPNRLVMTPNGEIESVGPNRHTFDSSHLGGNAFTTERRLQVAPPTPPQADQHRRWAAGDRLPPSDFGSNRQITRYGLYGLTTPPPGAVWVRNGRDALLVNRTSGEIIQAQYGTFH